MTGRTLGRLGSAMGCLAAILCAPAALGQTYLIDFGPSGTPTASPDVNGNTWNNFSPGQFIRVADTTGAFPGGTIAAGIGFGLTTGSGTSALPDEGLLNPDPNLLGELAIETATQDHMFNFDFGGVTLGGEFSSVDPSLSFTFSFLSTRAGVEGETRIALTDASGTAEQVVTHTSNTDTLLVFEGVQAQANGTIQFELSAASGDFMFINALKIEVEGGDPGGGCTFGSGTTFLIDTGPLTIAGQPATTASPDANGNTWNNFSPGQFIRVLDTDGQPSLGTIPDGIGFGATTGVAASVLPDEGLLNPEAGLLCDLAVESATQDHIFNFDFGGVTLELEFSSVDPEALLTVSLLATRNGVTGETAFDLTDASGTRTLTVAHANNAETLVVFEDVQAQEDGTIQLVLSAASGDFMFLNAIKIEAQGSGGGGCNVADLVEPFGILDLSDINAFVIAFTTQDPVADIDNSGIFDLADITAFVGAFSGGCP